MGRVERKKELTLTSRTRGGYAVVIELTHDLQRPVITGAYDGPTISSSALEAIAVFHAIALYPPNKSLTIFTDSMNVVTNFTRIQLLKTDYLIGKRRKIKPPTLWAAMLHLIVNRPSPVTVTWVKGHSDNAMNNHADLHAGIACNDPDLPAWHLFDLYHSDTKFHFEIDNVQCLDHTPHAIKSMFNFVHSKQWDIKMREHFPQLRHCELPTPLLKPHARLNSKHFPDTLPTFESAMQTLPDHLKKKHTSFTHTLDTRTIQLMSPLYKHNRRIRSTDTDTQRRSHRTKKLMKRLFTHDLGYALGSPFPNPYCKCCIDLQTPIVETQEHIWHCPYITNNTRLMLDHIWRHLLSPLQTKLTWAHWHDYYNSTLTEGQVLKTDYIIYGALPSQLIETAVALTQIPISTISKLFQNALYHIETALYRLIWKPRCKKTIKWENRHNINQKDKHHYDYTLQKQRHNTPVSPLQMNLRTIPLSQQDKDTAWDLALRAWTTEHRLGGWHLVPLTDTTTSSVMVGSS